MRRRVLAVLVTLAAVGFPARAAELIPGWRTDVVWDSNVLRSSTSPESAYSFPFGPTLRLYEPQGDFTYDAKYQATYEAYTPVTGINGFNQFFDGQSAWRATPTTTFTFNDDFAYTNSLNAIFTTAANQIIVTGANRQRITTNDGHVSMIQRLGPLWQLTLSGDNVFYNYQDPIQSDSVSTTGTAQLTRSVTPRLIVGGGGRYQRQDFSSTTFTEGSGTSFYQAFGLMQYSITPTLNFLVQGGPAYAVPDQPAAKTSQTAPTYLRVIPSTCKTHLADGTPLLVATETNGGCTPSQFFFNRNGQAVALVAQSSSTFDVPFVGKQQTLQSSLNYFGKISLDKSWRLWHGSISYQRSASSGSGLGTSTNLDTFSGELTWHPTEKWDVTVSGEYSTQSAISSFRAINFGLETECLAGTFSGVTLKPCNQIGLGDTIAAFVGVPISASLGSKAGNAYNVSSYLMELHAERRITKRLTLDGSFSWFQQQNKGAQIVASNQTIYRVVVGFTWNFDPIPL